MKDIIRDIMIKLIQKGVKPNSLSYYNLGSIKDTLYIGYTYET